MAVNLPASGVATGVPGSRAPILSPVALPVVEVQGSSHLVSFVSASFCALLGKTSQELVGKTFAEIASGDRECVAPLDHAWQAAEATAQATPAGARRTDEGAPVLYASWPTNDGADTRTGVVIQMTKSTSLRRTLTDANEALLLAGLRQHELTEAADTLNGQLQQEVAERGRVEEALRHAMQDLAVADRNKDAFLAMLAHELRSPLGPIRNAAHLLETVSGDDDGDVAVVRRSQEIIERQVAHLARLVDELLDVARIQQGKIVLRTERLDLVKAVKNAVQTCEQIVRARQHTITLDMPQTTGPTASSSPEVIIDGDATRIEQIVVNLISNAAKFTPPGGRIRVAVGLEDGAAVVVVSDNGVGLAPEMVGHVFDAFAQVEQTIAHSQGGLGLGLKIVRDLVHLHGGTVEARSAGLCTGTEFVVRLPALQQRDQTLTAMPVVAKSSAWRVLVVDDSRDNREMLELLLSAFGHTVDTAEDGEEAVHKALQTLPDVALVDIGLPKLSGYDVARAIRNDADGKNIVLIAVSGYGQPEDKRKALDAGFDAHLTKPVSPDQLRQILGDLERFGRGVKATTSTTS